MKFSIEERRQMLDEVLIQHQHVSTVARKHGINKGRLYVLVARAKKHGSESVLPSGKNKKYPAEFKIEVVKHYKKTNSAKGTALEFNIETSLVHSWLKKYSEKGIEAFSDVKRGKLLIQDKEETKGTKKKRVHTEKEYEELERRLRRAEMENEFLKKLDALVRERIEREKRK